MIPIAQETHHSTQSFPARCTLGWPHPAARAGPVATKLLKILHIQLDEEDQQEPQERALWSWQGVRARVPGSFVILLPFRGGRKDGKGS